MAPTHKSNGTNPRFQPIYQAVLAVPCRTCHTTHRLIVESDDREFCENTIDHLVHTMEDNGHRPVAALVASLHPATDLCARDWQPVDEMIDKMDAERASHEGTEGMPF